MHRQLVFASTGISPHYSVDFAIPSDPNINDQQPPQLDVCAKFVTTNRNGRRDAIVLTLDKPVTIGRNLVCSYIIPEPVVSSLHCKLYAIRSSTGGIIVSCQDLSTNGLVLNGRRFRKSSMIITDGDTLRIPSSQTFECVYIWRAPPEKSNIFDPTPPPQPAPKRIGRYVVTSHCLGSGSFATVHLGIDTVEYRQVACKSIKTKKEGDLDKVMKEVKILLSLTHPNINNVFDVEVKGNFLHIFLQLCTGGDLFTYIVSRTDNRLCEGETKYIMYQLLEGIKYLHDKMISHRDLKPENLLLHSPGPYPRILIADFGLARPKAYQETLNVCGTVAYLPPEGILALDNKHLGYVGMPADCWSAGVILYVMLAGSHPFDRQRLTETDSRSISSIKERFTCNDNDGQSQISQVSIKSENRIKSSIINGSVRYPIYIWDAMPDAQDLVCRLLVNNPVHRATIDAALQSKWITNDLIELKNAYKERISDSSSRNHSF